MVTLNSFILLVCLDFCLQIICLLSQFEAGDDMALRPEQRPVCRPPPPPVQCTFCLEVLFWPQMEREALGPKALDTGLKLTSDHVM